MTEEKFREIFAGTGWDVSYVDESDEMLSGHRRGRVALTSSGVRIIAGTTWREYGQDKNKDKDEFRGLVFENAARDLSGEIRPGYGYWSFPNFTSGEDFACMPVWLEDGGRCLVSSVEEFAFKLAALGPGENLGKSRRIIKA